MLEMLVDRAAAHEEHVGDFLIRLPLGGEDKHVDFSPSESIGLERPGRSGILLLIKQKCIVAAVFSDQHISNLQPAVLSPKNHRPVGDRQSQIPAATPFASHEAVEGSWQPTSVHGWLAGVEGQPVRRTGWRESEPTVV